MNYYYKLVNIDNQLHNDLQYWFETGRTIIIKAKKPVSDDEQGPNKNRFIEVSNAELLVEIKKNNALVITASPPTVWLPDPEWHKRGEI